MKLKQNKKAIALSIRMLVVLILAIVIFGFGVSFLYNIMSKAFKLKGVVDEDLDRQIETILCDKPVCLAVNYKKIYRKEYEVIGLRIYNTYDSPQTFIVTVNEADPKGYNKTNAPFSPDDPSLYVVVSAGPDITKREIDIGSRKERGIGIGIEVPKNAKSGIYVFNLNVKVGISDYPPPQQIRIEVP